MSFPKYDEYKESNVDWLGKVPGHWQLCPLGSCFRERREKVNDTDYPPLSVTKNGIVPQLEHAAKTDDNENRKCVLSGDFVINSRSDRKGSSGMATENGSVSLINTVLRPNEYLNIRFIHHLLRSVNFQEEYYRFGKGIVADLWSTNYSAMKGICLAIPEHEEQTAIANFLDAETSKIDALVAEQRRLIELLKEKRQAVISHAVTKGLNPKAPMKDSGIEWLGEVPEHWAVNRVKNLTKILRGKFTHRPRNDPRMYDGPYPFIQTGEISPISRFVGEHHQTLSEEGYKVSKKFPSGTLVMTITGAGTANVAILNFEACFPDSIVGFVPTDGVSIDYLYNLFIAMREALLSTAVTNTQPNLNIERIGALLTVKPPLNEQLAIVGAIERESGNYDTLIMEAERAIELLQERRTALISAAVTGKIDVREYATLETA